MNGPHCQSQNTREVCQKNDLGYSQFYYRACTKQYNESADTALNYITHR